MPLPDQLNIGELPSETAYLWEWWCEMRTMNGDDFTASSVESWFRLMGIKPEPWEVQAVLGVWWCLQKSRQSD